MERGISGIPEPLAAHVLEEALSGDGAAGPRAGTLTASILALVGGDGVAVQDQSAHDAGVEG